MLPLAFKRPVGIIERGDNERTGKEHEQMAGGTQNNWITAEEAAKILTENSGHKVNRQYIRKLVQMGRLSTKQIDKRTFLYNRHQVEQYRVSTQRGRRASKKSDEKVEPAPENGAVKSSLQKN